MAEIEREKDDYRDRYAVRDDETTLAPIIIKYGAAPVPDTSTPEGRHELDLNTIIFVILVLLAIGGAIFLPVK